MRADASLASASSPAWSASTNTSARWGSSVRSPCPPTSGSGLVAVQPGEEHDAGLVGEVGDETGSGTAVRSAAAPTRSVAASPASRGCSAAARRARSRRTAEQRVARAALVTEDQAGVVEVVAGVEPHALGQPPQRDLARVVEQRDLDAIDPRGVVADEGDAKVHRRTRVGASPVSGELRIEHVTEPVEDEPAGGFGGGFQRRPQVVAAPGLRGPALGPPSPMTRPPWRSTNEHWSSYARSTSSSVAPSPGPARQSAPAPHAMTPPQARASSSERRIALPARWRRRPWPVRTTTGGGDSGASRPSRLLPASSDSTSASGLPTTCAAAYATRDAISASPVLDQIRCAPRVL